MSDISLRSSRRGLLLFCPLRGLARRIFPFDHPIIHIATEPALQEVIILDTFYRERYATDPGVLSGWQSAKNTKGPFHRAEDAPPAGAVGQAA